MKNIKCIQLFETYGEAYQPYIPPVIEALKGVKALKIEVLAFKGNSNKNLDILPKYYLRKIKEKLFGFFNSAYRDLNYFEILSLRKKVDIIHIQQSYLFPKVLTLLEKEIHSRPKIIITLRGGDTFVKPWYMPKWQDFYKNYGNKVDTFIVMSQHQKDYLHTKWFIDLERIQIIPISFGYAFESSAKSVDKTQMKIVSAFRMCWEKNIEGNLRVIKLLKNHNIPVKYDLYGDGSDSGQVYYLIDKYQLNDCVTYHGRTPNKNLKIILSNYDFFLQLSHSESLGMSVIEAQALGLPAIVSDSDGLPEVVVNNKTGYCLPPHDSEQAASYLIHLWNDEKLYSNFSKEAIIHSQSSFSIKQEVEKLTTLYKTILTN